MGLASVSPVAVDVQNDVRGADGQGHLVPLVVGQAVREHLGVGLLTSGAVVQTHFAALAAALQLQEPAGKKKLLFPGSNRFFALQASLEFKGSLWSTCSSFCFCRLLHNISCG